MAEILTSIPYSAREKRGYWGQWFGTLKGREAIGIDRKANRLKKKKKFAGPRRDNGTQSGLWSLRDSPNHI